MTESQATMQHYSDAMSSARRAKSLMLLLIFLAIGIQVAAFILLRFTAAADASPLALRARGQGEGAAAGPAAASAAVTAPGINIAITAGPDAGGGPAGAAAHVDARWHKWLYWILPINKFAGFFAAALLVVALLLAVTICLTGRLAGPGLLTSSFFWSVGLLILLTPWQQVFVSSQLTGVLFNLGDLTAAIATVKSSWGATSPDKLTQALHYVRFLAYPGLTLLVWLAVAIKSDAGCRAAIESANRPALPATTPTNL